MDHDGESEPAELGRANACQVHEFDFQALRPSAASEDDRARFCDLVANAGEVIGAALVANVANARVLVTIKDHGTIRGIAALKRPQRSYRQKISKQAGVELLESEWPYELGYIYIEPELQGRGLSHRLVSDALKHRDNAGVFATVRMNNDRMRAALQKAGFATAGRPYEGLQGGSIGVLLNFPADELSG